MSTDYRDLLADGESLLGQIESRESAAQARAVSRKAAEAPPAPTPPKPPAPRPAAASALSASEREELARLRRRPSSTWSPEETMRFAELKELEIDPAAVVRHGFFNRFMKAAFKATADHFREQLAARDARIGELEARVNALTSNKRRGVN